MAEFLLNTVWLIPVYGFLGAILTLPWSLGLIRRTGPKPAAYINILMTLVAFVHGSIVFNSIWTQQTQKLVFDWLQVADLKLTLAIELSPVSLGALELVTGISLLTQLYALGYMEKDWSVARFFGLMGFFEAALGGIALSDSLLLSYGLLELLTLSTYLLVGFWYAQPLVVTAARDAFLTKRVGDILLLMGIVTMSAYGADLDFSDLTTWSNSHPLDSLGAALVGLSLIAGPTGKCAQFPLNLWLDEAMEGPNPAGILRNSIVVSAGAYVLIKLQPVFTLSPVSSDALIILGTVTVIGTSLMAIAQIDIKRALSHSTSAYLGLVFIAVGLGQVDIAFLLLFTHAIAKALLFMSAGSVILTTSNQNVTEMGGLWSRMPATAISFVVGSAGLLCITPLGMFWTFKRWFSGSWDVDWWLLAIVMFANVLSAINLTRLFRIIFLGEPQAKTRRAPEVPWQMAVPMISLAVVTLLAPLAPLQWSLWLSPNTPLALEDNVIQLATPLLIASGVLGCIIGSAIKVRQAWARSRKVTVRFFQDLFAYDFYIDRLYEVTIVAAVSSLSKITSWIDRYIVDGAVNLVSLATLFSGNALKYNVSGQSQFYILTILLGVSFLLWSALNGQWSIVTNYWSSLIS
ncbi:NAD(P)H dehydrogenase, subunit NdhF3 family [Hyella patelloides LEGE 07179]|uniref:NAD(P)H dehydrogenase, subunit NdhF3 family n=1 Tax=Hyella patelloides LEGE 07179 TaxID=945734 RepID=A0A563W355_9CYAN|nr:NAD(P)H-quinone oxidoreductase subunit F [Hyella patelloides]VEP18122.1 NAD(P)H dehydrogenase, subunit NdhF3 family [Hyella patelloides LEGE 07179]